MDYVLSNGASVRKMLEGGPVIHSLKGSSLSNHLGFNGFIETSDVLSTNRVSLRWLFFL